MNEHFLRVDNVVKKFAQRGGLFSKKSYKVAVGGVSFDVRRGETIAIVGESGSGKTTLGQIILGLQEPTSGQVLFQGKLMHDHQRRDWMEVRRQMQVVFQDPYASLHSRMMIKEILTEGMQLHKIETDAKIREERAAELLRQVGMSPDALTRYSHEFSGGQRQRIAIARALSVEPTFIVLDEPTSALDVSVQSQVLNLLGDLQEQRGLTYLLITHNLDVVAYLSDEILVMDRGLVVERGTVDQIFDDPQTDATRKLLGAMLSADPDEKRLFAAGVE